MKRFKRILVATDTRFERHAVFKEAVLVARECGARLTIVDGLPDLPWIAQRLWGNAKHMRELFEKEKREKLEQLAEEARQQGVDAHTKLLHGKTSLAIISEVIREGHDLVMRVSKGAESRSKHFFGTTGYRLLRECPATVWLVGPDAKTVNPHVLACVNTSSADETDHELNDGIIDAAKTICAFQGGRYSVLHSWELWGENLFRYKLPAEEVESVREEAYQREVDSLHAFLKRHAIPPDQENVHLIEGEPTEVIEHFVTVHQVDLVVMGTAARTGVAGVLMGNTAESILDQLQVSVMALKPTGFRSAITPQD